MKVLRHLGFFRLVTLVFLAQLVLALALAMTMTGCGTINSIRNIDR